MHNLNYYTFIAMEICTNLHLEEFKTDRKREVAKIFHNYKDNYFFVVDCFEHSHLERLQQNPDTYRLVKAFHIQKTSELKQPQILIAIGAEISSILKPYISKYNLKLTESLYFWKEIVGYYTADLQRMLIVFKNEIYNLDTETFKYFNAALTKKNIDNKTKFDTIFSDLAKHFKNFEAQFFCHRMQNNFAQESAIKIEFTNSVYNYIVGTL